MSDEAVTFFTYWYIIPAIITAIAAVIFVYDGYQWDKEQQSKGSTRRNLTIGMLLFAILVPFIPVVNAALAGFALLSGAEVASTWIKQNAPGIYIWDKICAFFNQPVVPVKKD